MLEFIIIIVRSGFDNEAISCKRYQSKNLNCILCDERRQFKKLLWHDKKRLRSKMKMHTPSEKKTYRCNCPNNTILYIRSRKFSFIKFYTPIRRRVIVFRQSSFYSLYVCVYIFKKKFIRSARNALLYISAEMEIIIWIRRERRVRVEHYKEENRIKKAKH